MDKLKGFLCWLGFHKFSKGWFGYGARVLCLNCGKTFRAVRDGASDDTRFDQVGA